MARHDTPDLRDRVEYALLCGTLAALRLPPPGAGTGVGRGLGRWASRWVPIRREVALRNLRASFPEWDDAACLRTYRAMCELLGQTFAEFARFPSRRREDLVERMDLENMSGVDRALASRRGLVLLTGHFGNWELLGASFARRGYPMTAVGARQRNPLAETLFTHYRANMGLGNINVGNSLRPLVKALSEGACLATLADQDGGPDGFFLPFLGRPASVQAGIFRLMARRGTPMITGFAIREGDGWRGEIQDPEYPRSGPGGPEDPESEARRLASLYTSRVESYVRRHPDHWFWLHRRWRTQPPARG